MGCPFVELSLAQPYQAGFDEVGGAEEPRYLRDPPDTLAAWLTVYRS